jgi:Fe-S-cluster containining protein
MDQQPWYREGLRFECTQCGNCCSGEPGYVWVNAEEIAALAQAVGEDNRETFERKYVRRVGMRKSLVELPNGDCVFLDGPSRRCTVYAARPRQCRTWPFWDSNLRSVDTWQQTCDDCPGAGHGRLYQLEDIDTQRKVMRV